MIDRHAYQIPGDVDCWSEEPDAGARERHAAPAEQTVAAGLLRRQACRESAARSYPRRLPVALAAGRGTRVWDTEGREYLDCLGGAGALALGHDHPVVTAAIQATLRRGAPLSTLDLATPERDRFVETLFGVLPPGLAGGCIQFCGPTGADAVEAATKLARTATGRAGMIAFGGGYHGMTQGVLALTGRVEPKLRSLLPPSGVQHLPFPDRWRCPFGVGGDQSDVLAARLLAWMLDDDHSGVALPAAVIMEPTQGESGVHPASPGFARSVRSITAACDVPLVLDEVQTGLGRTGTLWGCERLGIEPDILVLSKAIGGGLPLAVIVYRRELDVWAPGAHAGTFRGNQLAFSAGAAVIAEVVAEDLSARADVVGERLLHNLRLVSAGNDLVGECRGRGLMVGVELVDPERLDGNGLPVLDGRLAAAVQAAMLQRGVIVEVGGRGDAVVRLLPPLIITEAEADQVVAVFADALRHAVERRAHVR